MFSFFKKKPAPPEPVAANLVAAPEPAPVDVPAASAPPAAEPERRGWLDRLKDLAGDLVTGGDAPPAEPPTTIAPPPPSPAAGEPPAVVAAPSAPVAPLPPVAPRPWAPPPEAAPTFRITSPPPAASSHPVASPPHAPVVRPPEPEPEPEPEPSPPASPLRSAWAALGLPSFDRRSAEISSGEPAAGVPTAEAAEPEPSPLEPAAERRGWFDKLRGGLRKTGSSLTQVFTGTRIDEALYEELEAALLMADAGVRATEFLLSDLKRRVKEAKAIDPAAVKSLLADAIADLLQPLEKPLVVGEHVPTVMMVVGVNGAGKTTTIGKLTRHLAAADQKVLLAAADTFRAAAREQLAVWAGRNQVEIVSQEGGDPAAVTFDSVIAGKARGCDVVIADTAGRLTTQVHLMDELKKIRRVIGKAQAGAPHEVLLVVDGNTGQNALSQVQIFDAALGLTGLVITKLDGTAKGGVLAAIALWSRDRQQEGGIRPLPVYFIGVGEKLEDLQTFDAREFAQALLG